MFYVSSSSQKWPLPLLQNEQVQTKHVFSVYLIFQLSLPLLFKWKLTGEKNALYLSLALTEHIYYAMFSLYTNCWSDNFLVSTDTNKTTEHLRTGRRLWRSPGPIPCSEKRHTRQDAQDNGQSDCDHLQGWKYPLRQPVQLFNHHHSEKGVCYLISSVSFQARCLFSCHATQNHWQKSGFVALLPTPSGVHTHWQIFHIQCHTVAVYQSWPWAPAAKS